MIIYLFALPVWNFVLPSYAYWHFDDFSWGQTRAVAGEKKGDADHSHKEGEFDINAIPLLTWAEWSEAAQIVTDSEKGTLKMEEIENKPEIPPRTEHKTHH